MIAVTLRRRPGGRRRTTVRTRSTTRGPHREAMSSSSSTTSPLATAVMASQPGRADDDVRRLPAALGVGEEDQVGVGRDDELGVELRVPAAVALGLVGDVAQADEVVHLADERVRRDREVGVVELVVVATAAPPAAAARRGSRRCPPPSGRRARRPRRRGRSPRRAARSGRRRRRWPPAPSPPSGRGRASRAGRSGQGGPVGDHQVGLVAGDRLDVRLERRQVGDDTGLGLGEVRQLSTATTWSPAPMANSISVCGRRQRDDAAAGRRPPMSSASAPAAVVAGATVAAVVRRRPWVRSPRSSSSSPHAASRSTPASTPASDGLHTVPPSRWRTRVRQRHRESALASRVWLSHAGPGDRTRPRLTRGFTVAGQCRDLTGLRWVLRPAER